MWNCGYIPYDIQFIYPETTVKSAALVAAGAGSVLNKTNTLINYGYVDQKTGTLNKEGRGDLNDIYENNQKFKDEIINFVRDKAGLINEQSLDKRYKNNTLNMLGMKTLAGFVWSSDYTMDLIEMS